MRYAVHSPSFASGAGSMAPGLFPGGAFTCRQSPLVDAKAILQLLDDIAPPVTTAAANFEMDDSPLALPSVERAVTDTEALR
jgi:hypothetical protein